MECLHIGRKVILAAVSGPHAGQQQVQCERCGARTQWHKYGTKLSPDQVTWTEDEEN